MFSSLSRLSSSLVPRLTRCHGELTALRSFSVSGMPPGSLDSFQHGVNSSENVATGSVLDQVSGFPERNHVSGFPERNHVSGFPERNHVSGFPERNQVSGFPERNQVSGFPERNHVSGFPERNHVSGFPERNHISGFPERNFRSMNFVRGIIDQDGRDNRSDPQFQFPIRHIEHNADVVHIKLMRNNTFVTVTDSKGNKKLGASAGSVPEMKGGAKLSRYAAEATAEHVGRMSRNFGLKSVVMKVKGFTYFKKKKQAILSWKDGFTNSKVGQNPVIYIEDTTRKPHNGCRLRKKRRV